MRTITQANSRHGVWLAFLLIPLSGLATDIYLPSLPSIALAMGGSPSAVQLSLTIFLVGYGVGQLFIGNFMDSFGRYRIAVIALFLFGLSSLLIAFTHSIVVLNLLRLAQGLLAAVVVVAKRTFFVDVFTGATVLGDGRVALIVDVPGLVAFDAGRIKGDIGLGAGLVPAMAN